MVRSANRNLKIIVSTLKKKFENANFVPRRDATTRFIGSWKVIWVWLLDDSFIFALFWNKFCLRVGGGVGGFSLLSLMNHSRKSLLKGRISEV